MSRRDDFNNGHAAGYSEAVFDLTVRKVSHKDAHAHAIVLMRGFSENLEVYGIPARLKVAPSLSG